MRARRRGSRPGRCQAVIRSPRVMRPERLRGSAALITSMSPVGLERVSFEGARGPRAARTAHRKTRSRSGLRGSRREPPAASRPGPARATPRPASRERGAGGKRYRSGEAAPTRPNGRVGARAARDRRVLRACLGLASLEEAPATCRIHPVWGGPTAAPSSGTVPRVSLWEALRLSEGVRRARSPEKPSEVSCPTAASSPSPASTWVGGKAGFGHQIAEEGGTPFARGRQGSRRRCC